jgi:Uma2 family endonuclease
MTTATKRSAKRSPAPALFEPRRFTIDEYYRMAEAGILAADERVELVSGVVVRMPPISGDHAIPVDELAWRIIRHLPETVRVRVQGPIRIPPDSEPEPDLVVVPHRPEAYRDRHPGPDDVLLLIEVAVSTLRYDRDLKLPLYAAAGIREAWLFDVRRHRVLVCREPHDGRYTSQEVVERNGSLTPLAFPDLTLEVADILA